MKKVEKQRKPLVFRVGSEGGVPSLQVVKDEELGFSAAPKAMAADPGGVEEQNEKLQELQISNDMMENPVIADAIFVNREGHVTGPFTEKELRRHWANGVIHSDDYVWKEGMAEWIVLGSYFGVPVLSTNTTSISSLSKIKKAQAEARRNDALLHSWLVIPILFSVISMLAALFFVVIMPENQVYFLSACGATLVLAIIVCIASRKLSLVLMMSVNLLLPALAWYYMSQHPIEKHNPGDTVEQKEQNLPASTTPAQVASKKV